MHWALQAVPAPQAAPKTAKRKAVDKSEPTAHPGKAGGSARRPAAPASPAKQAPRRKPMLASKSTSKPVKVCTLRSLLMPCPAARPAATAIHERGSVAHASSVDVQSGATENQTRPCTAKSTASTACSSHGSMRAQGLAHLAKASQARLQSASAAAPKTGSPTPAEQPAAPAPSDEVQSPVMTAARSDHRLPWDAMQTDLSPLSPMPPQATLHLPVAQSAVVAVDGLPVEACSSASENSSGSDSEGQSDSSAASSSDADESPRSQHWQAASKTDLEAPASLAVGSERQIDTHEPLHGHHQLHDDDSRLAPGAKPIADESSDAQLESGSSFTEHGAPRSQPADIQKLLERAEKLQAAMDRVLHRQQHPPRYKHDRPEMNIVVYACQIVFVSPSLILQQQTQWLDPDCQGKHCCTIVVCDA